MKQKSYFAYDRINLDDCLETMGISDKDIRDRALFSFRLSDLLRSYDELACAMHDHTMELSALIHLYSRMHELINEFTLQGIRSTLNDIISEECAIIFATATCWERGDTIKFASLKEMNEQLNNALKDLIE